MRTVVGLYDRFEDAQQAVQALVNAGFSRDEISFIARDASGNFTRTSVADQEKVEGDDAGGAATGAGVGAAVGGLAGLLVGLGALAIPGIGPVVAAGPLISTLAGAGIGVVTGGMIGSLTDMGVPEEHANLYAEGVRRGGALVVVSAADERVNEALSILNRFHPVDIDRYGETWRQQNWSRFDETTPPLEAGKLEFNRAYYQQTGEFDPRHDRSQVIDRAQDPNRMHAQESSEGFDGDTELDRERDLEPDRPIVMHPAAVPVTGSSEEEQKGVDLRGSGDTNLVSEEGEARRPTGEMDQDRDYGDMADLEEDDENFRRAHRFDTAYDRDPTNVPVTGGVTDAPASMLGTDTSGIDTDDFSTFEPAFRMHFEDRYSVRGYGYETYRPAYQFGFELARDSRYRGMNWLEVEDEARREWELRGEENDWEDIRDAVRHAWEVTTG